MKWPDFLIIGAQRCGTSSLHHYLSQHPGLQMSEDKEVHFFDLNTHKGPTWYKKQFTGRMAGEATPIYLFYPGVEDWVAELMPRAKLIILLRDPVERAYSHYHHALRSGLETLSFEGAIQLEEKRTGEMPGLMHHSYVSRGIYGPQLARWFARFNRRQFLVLKAERFFEDERAVLDEVCAFLGVGPMPAELDLARQNAYEYPPMWEMTRQRLVGYYSLWNAQVEQLLGADFVAGWGES